MRIILFFILCSFAYSLQGKQSESRLVVGISQEFTSLHPQLKIGFAASYIGAAINRSLITIDENGQVLPVIVKTVPSLENGLAKIIKNKDLIKIESIWTIKDTARWGNGKPITGYDVKFSWKVGIHKQVKINVAEEYQKIENIIVDPKNPKKFKIIYAQPLWDFSRLLRFAIIPKDLEKEKFIKYASKGNYGHQSNYSTNMLNPGLYNGPYIPTEVKFGSHIILRPNKYFYGQKPSIDKVIFKLIPNTNTLEANLVSGNINMISLIGLSLDQTLAFEKKIIKNKLPYKPVYKDAHSIEFIAINLTNPILKNINIRKALAISIDKQNIAKVLFQNKHKPALHFITPKDPWYTESPEIVHTHSYSLRKAKKILAKEGWKLAQDGYRYKSGKKLRFQIMTTSGNKVRENIQLILKNSFKKIGVDLIIKNQPARVLFGETMFLNYPALLMAGYPKIPQMITQSYHSKNIPNPKSKNRGFNIYGWKNSIVDNSLENIVSEFNPSKRTKLIHSIIKQYTIDIPAIPLFYTVHNAIIPTDMKGFELTGTFIPPTQRIEFWKWN